MKAWTMPLLGKSRVDQAGAQTARPTLSRPLLPSAPLLAISTDKIPLFIRAGIRTTFKLLTLFFSFPSFYERQTPFPFPFPPVPAPITNDKFSISNSQWILPRRDAEFAEKKGKMIAFSAPCDSERGCLFKLAHTRKSSKTPAIAAICDQLPPLAPPPLTVHS
ncbi:MAG: hypothetical protein ABSG59_16940 [Verrucomicrobiota bacterium]